MKKFLFPALAAFLFSFTNAYSQFDFSDVRYWIGAGPDTALLVIDFQDETMNPSYAWGYLFDSDNSVTAQTMIQDIASADTNMDAVFSSGFLSDITFGVHSGIGGVPNYWSTWSGTNSDNFEMNMGASEVLQNGSWFGCSYTDFDPALEPTLPIAAFDPFYFTEDDVVFWVGNGNDTTLVIIDFLTSNASYAWGYLHDGPVTGETILNDIASVDPNLTVNISGGFLMDLNYLTHTGGGGNPNYWGTWSATNLGNWEMNGGLSETFEGGDILGCSYTDFSPALRPNYPQAAGIPVSVYQMQPALAVSVFPNPTSEILNVETNSAQIIRLFNAEGSLVVEKQTMNSVEQIDVRHLATGLYFLQAGQSVVKVTIQ